MRTLVLFTRDLRVHDHPALSAAAEAGEVLPLFVLDPVLLRRSPNRSSFLVRTVRDLHATLSSRGAPLVIRRGDPGAVAVALARRHRCDTIHVTSDATTVAMRRLDALRTSDLSVRPFPGDEVIPPGAIAPAGEDAYRAFTPVPAGVAGYVVAAIGLDAGADQACRRPCDRTAAGQGSADGEDPPDRRRVGRPPRHARLRAVPARPVRR